jgi:hypothetical protein
MKVDLESICLWPNGVWCYVEEIEGMNHMSDDYRIIPFGTDEYWNFLLSEEAM